MNKLHLINWIMDYVKGAFPFPSKERIPDTTHVLFLFVDHFELAGKVPRLSEWMTKYPQLALKHTDADGVNPKHTWFYALDLIREDELVQLRSLVESGFGEIELHWHHDHDTPHSFQEKLREGLKVFQKHGFMRPIEESKAGCFGFIHGNWSLNNACGERFCGVDNEIELLKAAGCYGDFTFPALHSVAQPNSVNAIYYANFTKGKAGYCKGRKAEVGKYEKNNEFMIFEGPLTINWSDWRFKWHPMIENGEIGKSCSHDDPSRIDAWVRQGIHVGARPDWVFIKVFCHGGQDHNYVLGETTDRMFTYLEEKYNDGEKYKLHYITAREAYNIVKAAEDGKTGDPDHFRDYIIPHPSKR
jgi:hypothetical protein